ncbi:Midasin [Thelohanellus kitauei]|uniref:Midasin n=1 Tax=Thelohanellus kitauei TaxID=669202 RepID=A0A0C2N493_THEKT|nr:Midasin [Thelohanellus kitauei]
MARVQMEFLLFDGVENLDVEQLKFGSDGKVISIGDFVVCDSHSHLKELVQSISNGKFTMLFGGDCCGKKRLLKNVALLLNYKPSEIVTIKLGPHIDTQELVGQYMTADSVSKFQWVPGILARAIDQGHFLVLDGWEHVGPETAQFLINVLDNRCLNLPNQTLIRQSKRFRMSGTFNSHNKCYSQIALHLRSKWKIHEMPPLSPPDIERIVTSVYRSLGFLENILCKIYHDLEQYDYRLCDFFRLCKHLNSYVHVDSAGLLKDPYRLISIIINHLHSFGVKDTSHTFHLICQYFSVDPCTAGIKLSEIDANVTLSYFSQSLSGKYFIPKSHYKTLHILKTCIDFSDPVLLVGETGAGKTALVQCLAKHYGRRLDIINAGRHTDISSLLGGIKPLHFSKKLKILIDSFSQHFRYTNEVDNSKFIEELQAYTNRSEYTSVLQALNQVLAGLSKTQVDKSGIIRALRVDTKNLLKNILDADKIAFQETLGVLTKAVVEGNWVLIDELNLAPNEVLATISYILENDSLYLPGCPSRNAPIIVNTNFRFFACMNPPNDVGKKVLPPSISKNFVKIFMNEISDENELVELIGFYLGTDHPNLLSQVSQFYAEFRRYFASRSISTTPNQRSLCRALMISSKFLSNLPAAVYESLHACFLPNLSGCDLEHWTSYLKTMFSSYDIGSQSLGEGQILVEGFRVKRGTSPVLVDKSFVITEIVKQKLKVLARIISLSNLPILLEGDTAVGKTSLVSYIAKITGNQFVRINNHEHTEIQDYIGSYGVDSNEFKFKEGPLISAMRRGDWVILDELNLAPSDVLETLNRLLDDNRELFIEETQEYVKAHDNFMIFATQNPAKKYSGRKELSRAFRSRFIEVNLIDLSELSNIEAILNKRFRRVKLSHFMISVMSELRNLRKSSDLFSGKSSYLTIRDLIKWSIRVESMPSNVNLNQMARIGYNLLSSRCRNVEDVETLHSIFKKFLNGYDLTNALDYSWPLLKKLVNFQENNLDFKHIIWTTPICRNAFHACKAFECGEPVLLVGETSSGKTTLCQLFAASTGRKVYIYNCHSGMEAQDIIGQLKIRVSNGKKEFFWEDGLLIQAMRSGGLFILDEISLADDSVLERINSVLENDFRALVLYESGNDIVIPHKDFLIAATMNPATDYGKRELSHTLRNRFTEIWCETSDSIEYYQEIIQFNLRSDLLFFEVSEQKYKTCQFFNHLFNYFKAKDYLEEFSIRKVLRIVNFINGYTDKFLTAHPLLSAIFDSMTTVVDHLNISTKSKFKNELLKHIYSYFKSDSLFENVSSFNSGFMFFPAYTTHFYDSVVEGPKILFDDCPEINLNLNELRKALLYDVPLLLEGPPGCGKTVSVAHLASCYHKKLTRINFSEHTELSDIFGTYVPNYQNSEIQFKWVNGPFIQAIVDGDWILLDEINLAYQTVLEGLNSCFDHRKCVYVSELDQTFLIDPSKTKIFATQNPKTSLGRKCLPRSFLDRFITVKFDNFSPKTLYNICVNKYSSIPPNVVGFVVNFIHYAKMVPDYFVNIRDAFRFIELLTVEPHVGLDNLFYLVFLTKVRDSQALELLSLKYAELTHTMINTLNSEIAYSYLNISEQNIRTGFDCLDFPTPKSQSFDDSTIRLLPPQFKYIGMLSTAVQMAWPCLITGPSSVSKTTILKMLSIIYGTKLKIVSLTSETDISDIIGDFSYCDSGSRMERLIKKLGKSLDALGITSNCKFLKSQKIDISDRKTRKEVRSLKLQLQAFDKTSKIRETLQTIEETLETKFDTPNISWQDGLLVNCIRKGHWILFDNINFCSPAIIDRLNCLLEPNGTLYLNQTMSVRPHKNFRFFGIYNPLFGELSHSLRNRCLELYIADKTFQDFDEVNHKTDLIYPRVNILFEPDLKTTLIKWDYDIIQEHSFNNNCTGLRQLLLLEGGTYNDLKYRCRYLKLKNAESITESVQQLLELNFSSKKTGYNSTFKTVQISKLFRTGLIDAYMASQEIYRINVILRDYLYQSRSTVSEPNRINFCLLELRTQFSQHLKHAEVDAQVFSYYLVNLKYFEGMIILSESKLAMIWNLFVKNVDRFPDSYKLKPILKGFKGFGDSEAPFDLLYRQIYDLHHLYFQTPRKFYLGNLMTCPNLVIRSENEIQRFLKSFSFDYVSVFNHIDDVKNLLANDSYRFNQPIFGPTFSFLNKIEIENESVDWSIVCFNSICRYIIGDFNTVPIHPFQITDRDKDYFHETLQQYNPLKLVDVYLQGTFPYAVKCKDIVFLSEYISKKSIVLWSNFNIFEGWDQILAKQMIRLLKLLVYSNFKPLLPSLNSQDPHILNNFISKIKETVMLDLIQNEIYCFETAILGLLESKLSTVGDSFIYFGNILLKIFGNLPSYDPSTQDHFHETFIINIIDEIDSEIELRLRIFHFYYQKRSLDALEKFDDIFKLLIDSRNIISTFRPKKPCYQRSESRFNELKSLLIPFINSLETNLKAVDSPNYMMDSITEFRQNLASVYTEFSNVIEPVYSAFLVIQFGFLLRNIPQHEILPICYNLKEEDGHIDKMATKALESLNKLDIVLKKYHQRFYKSKAIAFMECYKIIDPLFKHIEKILGEIESKNLLNIPEFKFIQPEMEYFNEFEDLLFKETSISERETIILFASKVSFVVFEKINLLLGLHSIPEFGHDVDWWYESSDKLNQIVSVFKMNKSFPRTLRYQLYDSRNIFECGNPFYVSNISTLMDEFGKSIETMKSTGDSSMFDEISSIIQQIGQLDIASPLTMYISKLFDLFVHLLNLERISHEKRRIRDMLISLKDLIDKTRKVRLESWKTIIKNYDRNIEQHNSLVFTSFFRILHDSGQDDQIFSLYLKPFIENQVVGTYSYTLSTLSDIVSFLSVIQPNIPKVNYLNILNYYKQFQHEIKNYKQSQSDTLNEELRKYSIIFKQQQIYDYYCNKRYTGDSIFLHKCVKDYQKIFNQPLMQFMNKINPSFNLKDYSVFEVLSHASIVGQALYPVTSSINLSGETLKLSTRFSNGYIQRMKSAHSTIQTKLQDVLNAVKCFELNEQIPKTDKNIMETIIDRSEFVNELITLELFDRTSAQISDFVLDFSTFDGADSTVLIDHLYSLYDSNNEKFISTLFLTQKITSKLAEIESSLGSKGDLMLNFHNTLVKQRQEIKKIVCLLSNTDLLKSSLNEVSSPRTRVFPLNETDSYRLCCLLNDNIEALNNLKKILENVPYVPVHYQSSYFPNAQLNHGIINADILSQVKSLFSQLISIKSRVNSFSKCYILEDKLGRFHTDVSLLKDPVKRLSQIMESFGMYGHNLFKNVLDSIELKSLQILQVLDDIRHNTRSGTLTSNQANQNVQNFVSQLLLIFQNIKTYSFKPNLSPGCTSSIFNHLGNTEHIVESLLILNEPSLTQLTAILVNNVFNILKETLRYLLKVNGLSGFVFYSILKSLLKSISLYLSQNTQANNQESNSAPGLQDVDQPAEASGFRDGRGHEDVTSEIDDQDILEQAIQPSMLKNDEEDHPHDMSDLSDSDGPDNGIELDDEMQCQNGEQTGQLDSENDENDVNDEMSSVSESICNDLDPNIWENGISDDDNLQEAKTEKNKIEGTDTEEDVVDNDKEMDVDEKDPLSQGIEFEDSIDEVISHESQNMSDNSENEVEDTINKKASTEETTPENENEDKIDVQSFDFPQDCAKDFQNGTGGLGNKNPLSNAGTRCIDDQNHLQASDSYEEKEKKLQNTQNLTRSDVKNQNESNDLKNELTNQSLIKSEFTRKRHSSDVQLETHDLKIKKCIINQPDVDSEVAGDVDESMNVNPCDINDADIMAFEADGEKTQLDRVDNDDMVIPEFDNSKTSVNIFTLPLEDKSEMFFHRDLYSNNLSVNQEFNIHQLSASDELFDKYESQVQEMDDTFGVISENQLLVCNLCEKLRMVLEPTKKIKFSGNYKTGKKINIRKIIPFIASKYTRDKIWLRRNKPSHREYQVIIAIDDSASMKDNNSRKIALESLFTISAAFKMLEIGKVAVLSFGAAVKTLLDFDEPVSDEIKQHWNNLEFHQKATNINSLLQFCQAKFKSLPLNRESILERLCIIISDGRGIYSEGENLVKTSIQELVNTNVLTIFVILDPKDQRESITHIQVPQFDPSGYPTMKSYLELFPFPHYIILRDVNHLPDNLSSIVQQWMQLFNE